MLFTTLTLLLGLQIASDPHICIDQFGYRPSAQKTAILREAVIGFDAPDSYQPGALVEIRRSADQQVVWSASPVAWNSGAVHDQSGDHVWWLDFTALQTSGTYYIYDSSNAVRSEDFRIAADVYMDPLRQAMRMYFIQRCNFDKLPPYADPRWSDTASHIGPQQDADCRLVTQPTVGTSRDLTGGWFDAGDYNKYINYADDAVHDLLGAFEEHPNDWGDDFNIPESGNGVPDILDEIRFELDWMLKMQIADGSVLHKIGGMDYSNAAPPSTDTNIRRYAPPTASATISLAGVCARAAAIYQNQPDASSQAFSQQLASAAVAAWDWLEANPSAIPSSYDNAGFWNADAEDQADWQESNMVRAAVHLFRMTGQSKYRDHVDANYTNIPMFYWTWVTPYYQQFQESLLIYTTTPFATRAVADDIRYFYGDLMQWGDNLDAVVDQTDGYRAYLASGDYSWGSNKTKSYKGAMYTSMNRYAMHPESAAAFLAAGEDFVHWLHGANPLGLCFLTNMSSFGAEGSANQMYHEWFGEGTDWDHAQNSLYGPAPGYLTGGCNEYYAPDSSYSGPPLVPPLNQPQQKSYKDWNSWWPENSYEVTEPQITYQAGYVRLLAEFAFAKPPALSLSLGWLNAGSSSSMIVGGANPGDAVGVLWGTQPGYFQYQSSGWDVALDLDVPGNPLSRLVSFGTADAQGLHTQSLQIPSAALGMILYFQAATQGNGASTRQSALLTASVE